jgi:hypothetical protein
MMISVNHSVTTGSAFVSISGFWIDEFIETTSLAVASRCERPFPLFHRFTSAREVKEIKIYDDVFSLEIKNHTENRCVD